MMVEEASCQPSNIKDKPNDSQENFLGDFAIPKDDYFNNMEYADEEDEHVKSENDDKKEEVDSDFELINEVQAQKFVFSKVISSQNGQVVKELS